MDGRTAVAVWLCYFHSVLAQYSLEHLIFLSDHNCDTLVISLEYLGLALFRCMQYEIRLKPAHVLEVTQIYNIGQRLKRGANRFDILLVICSNQ